jgi:BirA family biotin operon repressor/biotin-[acetyl-CoA-carboxylase] ligase
MAQRCAGGAAKLAGILLERVGQAVVVGVGVNLAQAPQIEGARRWRFPPGPAPDRDSFAASLASHFSNELALWRDYGLAALARRWQAVAHPPGTRLAVTDAAGGVLEGSLPGWTRGRCA